MYIRAKRKKTTLFLHVDPSDTILEVKQRIQELLQQAPDKQRLFKGSIQLEDSKKLADMQIGNDDVLAMTFCQPGLSPPGMHVLKNVPRLSLPILYDHIKFLRDLLQFHRTHTPIDGAWEDIEVYNTSMDEQPGDFHK